MYSDSRSSERGTNVTVHESEFDSVPKGMRGKPADVFIAEENERDFLLNNHRIICDGHFAPTAPDGIEQSTSPIESIDNLDLSMVKNKLCLPVEKEGKGWTKEQANKAEKLYKQFLKLHVLCPTATIVPTHAMDAMWHAHILDTMKYDQDCKTIFGKLLHHFPYFGLRGEEDAKNLRRAAQNSLSLFNEFFGEDFSSEKFSACTQGDCACA